MAAENTRHMVSDSNQHEDENAKAAGEDPASDDDRPQHDPRLGEVEGDEGFPGSFIDSDRNMPGDQPIDSTGPNKSELEGKQ